MKNIHHLWHIDTTYLNTASYGIPPIPTRQALIRTTSDWSSGTADPADWEEIVERARTRMATLVDAPTHDTALGTATSQIVGTIAASLPDRTRVLAPEGEYTSLTFPWHVQADRGITVTTAPLNRLADAVGPRTDVVVFSPVQSATGELAPTADIVTAARTHGALVIADATQAAGWLPLQATDFDALVASAYKWIMAPRGLAFAYLAPALRERLRPVLAGPAATADPATAFYADAFTPASDARAFDTSPNWSAATAASISTGVLLGVGIQTVHAHNTALADHFRALLHLEPAHSAITTVDIPDAHQRLARAGITASQRAGRTRLAFHLYNTAADAELAAKALR
ncbi:aminotransferase class V-fold PLP-dependent enzyme [Nocardiopsis algeriensis]|uniref:Selenocysteine lyase/cysteine desulfurase n=1 Tax=Nocardiopsis algeriensis TaxID=1478215 RepID=A0A841IMZ0_9ACTN|nr:selenocysteine lyase/cysteine desulfurase [Nocardiopsis algeriensis]